MPPGGGADDERRGGREVTVRCDKGRTIGDALSHHRGPLTIKVVGTCDEHVIGDAGFGLPTNNVIRGNATAAPAQGINVTNNSTLVLRNATVENNNGTGVALAARSVMTMFSGAVTGHPNNGVQLSQGSAAIFQPALPLPNLSGNTPFDLKCLDGESSHAGPIAPGATIDCTGF